MVLFCGHTKSQNTTKQGFQGAQEKTQNGTFGFRCHFGKGPRKGVLLSVIHKSCVLLKTQFYCVFSQTQLCRNKECKLKIHKFTKKYGVVCQHTKRCFLFVFFVFGWFSFFFFWVVVLFGWKKSHKKGIFCKFRVFCLFWSPKRPVFKILLFFFCCFFLVFLLSSLSNSIFFLWFFVLSPFLDSLSFFFGRAFFCLSFLLPFPLQMFACLFETNFLNIRLLKPKSLSCLAVCFYFSCFYFCFHAFRFCLSGFMLALLSVCVSMVFVLFLVMLSDYEKQSFPCNSSVFRHVGYKVVYFFNFIFLLLFAFLVVACFHF